MASARSRLLLEERSLCKLLKFVNAIQIRLFSGNGVVYIDRLLKFKYKKNHMVTSDNVMQLKSLKKQSGFIVLMTMMMLLVGAMVWFTSSQYYKSVDMKVFMDERNTQQLEKVKERMLAYAVLHPEIYSDLTLQPGVGYFPCPDIDGDGDSDGPCGSSGGTNLLYVLGKVPDKISTRNITFLDSSFDSDLFWYAVDSRFVASSSIYAFSPSQRFAPLNSSRDPADTPDNVDDASANSVPPMTLDGRDQIVMVLFYAGQPLAGDNRPSNNVADYLEQPTINNGYSINFVSAGNNPDSFNDYVIAITRQEWEAAVLARIARDNDDNNELDMCTSSPQPDAAAHWFNDCNYTGGSSPGAYDCANDSGNVDNLAGQGWRRVLGCP